MMHLLAPRPPAPLVAPGRTRAAAGANRASDESKASITDSVAGDSFSSEDTPRSARSGELPSSVRGAPPELRRAIRKRQNSESARRCRQRRKIAQQQDDSLSAAHIERLRRLEALIVDLAARLHRTQLAIGALAAHTQQPHAPSLTSPSPQLQQSLLRYDEQDCSPSPLTSQNTHSGFVHSTSALLSQPKPQLCYELPLSPVAVSPSPLKLGPTAHRHNDEVLAFATTVDELARE